MPVQLQSTVSVIDRPPGIAKPIPRRPSIDIYRGMVMFLMLAEVLHWSGLWKYRDKFSETIQNALEWIVYHTSHVEWRGCSLHDMIQPSFSFLVGTSLAFSFAKRKEQGQSSDWMFFHALLRSLILIFLGIFLRSLGRNQTNFTFDDTLTQIGLGYTFLYLFAGRKQLTVAVGALIILAGYWLFFYLYPAPGGDFDYAAVGVPDTWKHHETGIAAHWNKNSNAASAFDVWWMNLFPREKVFAYSGGGYCTLSFIPTLATMLLGLLAGNWLKSSGSAQTKTIWFAVAIAVCLGSGWALEHYGLCPIVKRIWTPSWVLWSGGICFAWLLVLSWICDDIGWTGWAYPWIVIGANSIAAYVMSWTMKEWTQQAIRRHFGFVIDRFIPDYLQPFAMGCFVLIIFWLILRWMYRQKIFVRI